MPLRVFSYPLPETRFFQAGSRVFKFKIRNGSNARGCEITDEQVSQEIEDAIRVVLANLDCLQPFATKHFSVFPCMLSDTNFTVLVMTAECSNCGQPKHEARDKVSSEMWRWCLQIQNLSGSSLRAVSLNFVDKPRELETRHLSVCHSKRSRREQPLEGSPVQLSLWEKTVLEGLEMDGEPHFWPSRPETMASDRGVSESVSLPHKDSPYAPHSSPTPPRLCYCCSHSQLPECFVPTHLGARNQFTHSEAVDGKEAREAQGEQGEPATEAQEGQPHTPQRSTPTGDHTSVFIRWA
ncbi:uncharacterized protein majin isoform X2 [Scleropages formosus]|nr:membrane-anchored junction protein isoform X2 [Scleropages formosus]